MSSFSVKQAIKRYKGVKGGTFVSDSRRPISLEILCGLNAAIFAVCSSAYQAFLLRSTFILAFFWGISYLRACARIKKWLLRYPI